MHSTAPIIIILLILFSIYRRARRSIGFQKFVKRRMFIRIALFSILAVLFLSIGFSHPMMYIFDATGAVLGGVIAYYAIRTTSFEWRKDAWFYRPNTWIGILVIVLFVGRIAYRIYQEYAMFSTISATQGQAVNQDQLATYAHDPYTAIILFILIIYYIVYYTFLIRKERHLEMDVKEQTEK